MDFVTLANVAHQSTRAIVRLLTEEEDDNDDFAQLENVGGSSSHGGRNGPAGSSPPPDAGDYHPSHEGGGGSGSSAARGGGAGGVPNLGSRPLLSPTAESALLSLCTNFLLYVAMVLITVMVARIYFPSWLEPREELSDANRRRSSAHSYMNVIEENASYSDEEEDDDGGGDDEEEDFIEAGTGAVAGRIKKSYKDDVNLLGGDGGEEGRASAADGTPPPPARKLSTISTFLDYDQETMSRESVYTNLAICAVMLNVTFVSWGLLQVRAILFNIEN
jgi:hypothetical protein